MESKPNDISKPDSADRKLIAEALRLVEEARAASDFEPDSRANLPPSGSFPGYEVIREIHRGGQGVVYLAIQLATKRKVAIKTLHEGPFIGSAGRARFEREVQVLGHLHHPHIVAIHDSGVTPSGHVYYVMDYIAGISLDIIISESGSRPIDESLTLFLKICDAVNAAHLRGVIHRDIKPANIRINANGDPVLVDFGLAKIAVADVTEDPTPRLMTLTGQFVGSLPWASPEQAEGQGEKIDVRTDVYSLGVILYQLLTGGKFPYTVIGNMRDVLDNILRAQPARPSTIRRKINDEVETIVLKCLSKDRDRRYQSAGELARDVRHYLNGEPIEAKRDSGWYVISKTLRRYRMTVTVAASFLVLLVIFAIAMTFMYGRARSAETLAESRLADVEREKARAESNLVAVRAMARTIIDDFAEEVASLRGGTRAQLLVLSQAESYLEQLKSQASTDPSFVLELVDAHDNLGTLLGGDSVHRAGATVDAASHFEESSKLLDSVSRDLSDAEILPRRALNIRNRAWIAHQQRRYSDAVALFEQSIQHFERAEQAAGESLRHSRASDRYRTIVMLGDALLRLSQETSDSTQSARSLEAAIAKYDEAAAFWRSRLESTPESIEAARELGVALDHRAAALIEIAALLRRRAQKLAADVGPEAASELLAESNTVLLRARTAIEKSLLEFRRLSELNPTNAELKRDVYLALHRLGITWSEEAPIHAMSVRSESDSMVDKSRVNALDAYTEAFEISDELANSDLSNLEAQRDLALILNKIGNERRELGRLGESREAFMTSLNIRRQLEHSDPMPRHTRDLAVGLIKLAEVEQLLAESQGDSNEARLGLEAALVGYERAITTLEKLVTLGVMRSDSPEIRQVNAAAAALRERGVQSRAAPEGASLPPKS